jgi:hypothetical protein
MRRSIVVAALSLPLLALHPAGSAAEPAHGKDQACVLEQSSDQMRCYSTLREMVDTESGGTYELPSSGEFTRAEVAKFNDALAARQGLAGKRSVLALGVNAILYDEQNNPPAGQQLALEAGSGCFGTTWDWGTLTASWQNRAESISTFRNCAFKIWAGPNRTGISFGFFNSATSLLNLNNNGESVRLQPR